MSTTKRRIFYSFHFANDVFRVQQVRNMGVIEGNEPVSPNTWEEIKRTKGGVERWIDDNMKGKSCVIVLIGTETAKRPWVQHEIKRAWELGKALLGIHVHNLKCPNNGTSAKGPNPFDRVKLSWGNGDIYVPKVYDPGARDAYGDIHKNMSKWVEQAIAEAA